MGNIFDWNDCPGYFPNEKYKSLDQYLDSKKKNNPVKYFLIETIPDYFFGYQVYIKEVIYKYTSLYLKKHHLVDIRTKNSINYKYGYCDAVEKILYANMAILCNFLEKEYNSISDIEREIEIEKDSKRANALRKALEIYNWWNNFHQYDIHELYKKASSTKDEIERENIWKNIHLINNKCDKDIQDKLKELIDIREFLWT